MTAGKDWYQMTSLKKVQNPETKLLNLSGKVFLRLTVLAMSIA